ncbi:hypothetical protein [Sphingomonas aracearum]|uniref:HTH marR-type domain-containing protein n=1 Tax=Sphingomonas aracearum TaxID=2283317 RepID=A0A369VUG0_9SPHN|nr:hypothetical protein [Sphingomonas aracearum]RDE04830.1 hypothetical protein DVW87_14750 [Sphingomonas aracearum]
MEYDSSVTRVGAQAGLGAPMLVIAEEGNGAEAWTTAAALIGGRVLERLGWEAVGARLGSHAVRPILLVDSWRADEAVLAEALPRIDTFARAGGVPVVVALQESHIDIVAATLMSPGVQLLCGPSMAERVAALAVAAEAWGAAPTLHDAAHEGEAERLQRLNAEIARIAELLARLTRGEAGGASEAGDALADRRRGFAAEPAAAEVAIDAAEVRRAIRVRRLREQFFAAGLFEDPAWDMLLDLFAAELEGNRVSVSSLCIAAAVAPTTALRWIGKMSEAGLLVRSPDPRDRRRAYMALSDQSRGALHGYVAALKRQGLALA